MQPHARTFAPGGGRAQAVAAGLVVAEVGIQQRQAPVAKVTTGCDIQRAGQRQIVLAEVEDRIRAAGQNQLFGG